MTINPKSLELRNLLPGQKPEGVPCCGVCGKPHSRVDKGVRELPIHKQALAEGWAEKFRTFTKQADNTANDFVMRKRFNAQVEFWREKLTLAREEHDAYTPPPKEEKAIKTATEKGMAASYGAKTVKLLQAMLLGVGVKVCAQDGHASTVHLMAELLHKEMQALKLIAEDAAATVQEAPAAPEAEVIAAPEEEPMPEPAPAKLMLG